MADFYSPDSEQTVLLGPGGPAIGRLPPTRAGILQTLSRHGGHLPERRRTLSWPAGQGWSRKYVTGR
ncbi:MAG: hypothetical protein L0214_07055, partial [candidate division NC10 bacterium]|nr:hypothetical protein [candidate division NC10 bacterium]